MRLLLLVSLIVGSVAIAVPATAGERDDTPAESDWWRVRKLATGTEMIVTVQGVQPATRFLVWAGESDVMTLDVTDPKLPPAVTRVLLNLASTHPEYLTSPVRAGQFMDHDVRVGPDGVFVADRRVTDLQRLVEMRARSEIDQITIRRKGRGVWGHLGALGGYFVGGMVGGYVAGFACQATVGRNRCDTGAFLSGMLVGGITGGVHGYRASNRETEEVVYRAP